VKKIKNRVISKIAAVLTGKRGRRGDSVAEVLVALLIAAVALVLLASLINTTVKLTNNSKKEYDKYVNANNEVELMTGEAESTGTATLYDENGYGIASAEVDYFVNSTATGDVIAYRKHN